MSLSRRSMMGYGKGGSVRKAQGTFTLNSDSTPPTITHNLGTKKIAMVIVPDGPVVAHAGYRAFTTEFINIPQFLETDYQFSVDISNYNSNYPEPIVSSVASSIPKSGNGNASPWKSQSNSLTAGTYYGSSHTNYTITDDSIKCNFTFASGTYRYIIWALE